MNKKVWFVTGCSHGMGQALVKELLQQGFPVAATSRKKESLTAQFGEESECFYPTAMDLTNEEDVRRVIDEVKTKFGRIDVVVNNAGYTHLATIEELSDKDAKTLFGINVFGTLNVIRNVLPIMREQHSGHIFNVSSLGAYNIGPLSGIYCATKHAVKAISETLAQEVAQFGIRVTDVKPGFIRTEFFGKSFDTTIPEGSPYADLYRQNMEFYMGQNGTQIGDPAKVAKLYIQLAEMENPPVNMPMGSDSVDGIRQICANTVKAMDEIRPLAATTDY